MKKSMMERLWNRIDTSDPDQCWEWPGATGSSGHGLIGDENRRLIQTHRAVYEEVNGPLPPGVIVRHTCDNPPCCHPNHLIEGTHADNRADCVSKRRHAFGQKMGSAKLTEAEAVSIFKDPRPQKEIAEEYGVTQSHISNIKAGKTWKHLHKK